MVRMNHVVLAGNLTHPPVLRETTKGNHVGSLRLALNDKYTRNGETNETVCFVDVEVWNKQAEACSRFLDKGSPVVVEGRLVRNEWVDRESGQNRSKLIVRAHRVQFAASPVPRATAETGDSAPNAWQPARRGREPGRTAAVNRA